MSIKPRTKVPNLDLPTFESDRFELAARRPQAFTMLVFHRRLHRPICKTYLHDLDERLEDLARRGVEVIAISTDTRKRAAQSKKEWNLTCLPLAYSPPIDQARQWGSYVSSSIRDSEPLLFSEPDSLSCGRVERCIAPRSRHAFSPNRILATSFRPSRSSPKRAIRARGEA